MSYWTVTFHSWRLHAAPDEPDAQQNKWDGQKLSHVEQHILFECLLYVLQIFDEETRTEDTDHECTEDDTAMLSSIGELVLVPADEEDSKISQGLIDLRWMRGIAEDRLCTAFPLRNILDESEAPRQGSLMSVDLVVEKIAHANQARYRSNGNRQSVEQPQL